MKIGLYRWLLVSADMEKVISFIHWGRPTAYLGRKFGKLRHYYFNNHVSVDANGVLVAGNWGYCNEFCPKDENSKYIENYEV